MSWSETLPSYVNSRPMIAARCGAPCGRCVDAKPVCFMSKRRDGWAVTPAARYHYRGLPMSLQILHPPGWLPPIGYANGISVPAGRIVFIAGQVGWDADQHFQSEELVPQFEQALKNILAVLAQAGGRPSHICRIYPVHVITRKSLGLMMRKLSVTESQSSAQFRGTFSRRKPSVASANWAQVA